nr:hypothetical protein [Tanacetum cinerariifolium]
MAALTPKLTVTEFMNKEIGLEDTYVNDRYANGMHAVPPPMIRNYMPSGPDVDIDYSKFTYEPSPSIPEPVENESQVICKPKVWIDAPIIEEYESDSDDDSVSNVQEEKEKPSFAFTNSVKHVNTSKENIKEKGTPNHNDPHKALKNKGIIDSGCSRHMTRNKAHLADYQEFKGGSFSFGGSNGRITGKGKIKTGRSDNRTEFKNSELIEFCGLKGIKMEYSNVRTPQQNGVAERKNKTLIEADGTMLADSFLPTTFWAEVVNTACYVLNRVLVTKPQNKKPYEILTSRQPIISYLRPFGCHVTILNTIDHLGKFDGKSDSRFVVGYSLNSKAFKVYNLETKRVEENLHVNFLENKPNVAGKGHVWMFDLDYLTNSVNYEPVLIENQANKFVEEINLNEEHFILPIWSAYSTTVKSSRDKIEKNEKPVSQVEQVFLKELEKLKKQKKEANDVVESLRKEATHDTQNARTSSTNLLNTASTPPSTAGPSRVFTDGALSYLDPFKIAAQDDPTMPHLEDIYASPSEGIFIDSSYDADGVVTDFNNLETTVNVNPTPTTRIHTIHPKIQILGDPNSTVQIRSKVNKNFKARALFQIQKVWILVDLPFGKKAIGTKWVYINKKDERGVVARNKARLVAQGHRQEEEIDYDEVFAHVARIEAIRIFLAFASYMGFIVYQMDVKNVFLYGTIDEEVYVTQPPGFVDPKFPNKVYKFVNALYGLHQAPRAWYATLSTFLENSGYRRVVIDKNLFIKKDKNDIMLVQVYVDDIIFGSTKKSWCDEFEELMKNRFQMSSMGELTFFLGLQVKQKEDGIFISQDKYVAEILKKFNFLSVKTASTPIGTQKPLVKDEEAADVDVHLYRYLKSKPKLGVWYPKVSSFDLEAYLDSDYACANLDRKAKTGEVEYMAIAHCCGQVLWIQNQLLDYGFNLMNTKIYIDNSSTICIVKNIVFHSKTKHIEIRHHFIRDACEKKLIQVLKIHTDDNVADLLTKAFDVSRNEGSLSVGFNTTQQTVISSPCLIHIKNWLVQKQTVSVLKPPSEMNLTVLWHQQSSVLPQTRSLTFQVDHQLRDMSHHQDIYDNPSLTKKVFANMKRVGTGFSRVITPLFENMLVPAAEEVGQAQDDVSIPTEPSTSKPHKKHKSKKQQPIAPKVPSPEPSLEHQLPSPSNDPIPTAKDSLKLQELIDLCTRLSNKVLDLKSGVIDIKFSFIDKIEKLEDRDHKLEAENRILKENHSNLQHSKKVLSMQDIDEEEPAEVEEVLEVVTAAKLIIEVVTIAEPTTIAAQVPKVSAPRKRRGVVIQDPMETTASVIMHIEVQSKHKGKRILIEEPKLLKGQTKIKQDEVFARQLEAELNANINWNDVIEQVKRSERQNNAVMSLNQETAKKHRMDKEAEELKKHLQIVSNDDDDVYTEATPLASKVPVVDYQIHHENNKPYYKIIRVDGSHKLFSSFITLLKNFDREDLETLWKLVKERFETTEPKIFSDDFLLKILKIMFEKPNIKANVWKDQKGIYGLAKKYPLTYLTLEKMLNNVKLEVKEESEMSLELLRLVRRQLNEGAFTASFTIPAIYIQQFWDTMCFNSSTGLYSCQLDEQWFNLHKDILIDALDITQTNDNNPFVAPPSSDTVIEYINTLGYPSTLRNVSAMLVNALYQPWRAILSMINMCLTGKTIGFDKPRHLVLQILWGIIHSSNIDYAERIWEEFVQSIQTFLIDRKNLATASRGKKKTTHLLIISIRFTKLIIHHLKTKHNIHPRSGSPLYYSHDESALNTLRYVTKRMVGKSSEHVAKYQQHLDAEHGKAAEGGATESL